MRSYNFSNGSMFQDIRNHSGPQDVRQESIIRYCGFYCAAHQDLTGIFGFCFSLWNYDVELKVYDVFVSNNHILLRKYQRQERAF